MSPASASDRSIVNVLYQDYGSVSPRRSTRLISSSLIHCKKSRFWKKRNKVVSDNDSTKQTTRNQPTKQRRNGLMTSRTLLVGQFHYNIEDIGNIRHNEDGDDHSCEDLRFFDCISDNSDSELVLGCPSSPSESLNSVSAEISKNISMHNKGHCQQHTLRIPREISRDSAAESRKRSSKSRDRHANFVSPVISFSSDDVDDLIIIPSTSQSSDTIETSEMSPTSADFLFDDHLPREQHNDTLGGLLRYDEQPDVYGQVHPIETPELVKRALVEFEHELRKLPSNLSHTALQLADVTGRSTGVVTPEFKLVFLRTEAFRIKEAVKRYAMYWNKRLQLFGTERAFRPLLLSTMTPTEVEMIRSCYKQIIPPPSHDKNSNYCSNQTVLEQRSIFFVDTSKYDKNTMQSFDFVRAIWYLLHSIIKDDIYSQQRGIIMVNNLQRLRFSIMPSKEWLKIYSDSFKNCIPLRLSAYHIVNGPPMFKVVYPVISAICLNERLRKRVLLHNHNINDHSNESKASEALQFWIKFGLTPEHLPVNIGGTYKLNIEQWIEHRLEVERE